MLGESENLIAANENNTRGAVTETVIVKTGGERVNSEDTVSPPIKRPTPQGFFKSLPLLAKEAKKMKDEGIDPVVFGLSDKDFQLLAKNFAQIRAHMMKLNVMIDEYKDYYESDVINNDKEKQEVKK